MNMNHDAPVELAPIPDIPETSPQVVQVIEGRPHLLGSECAACGTRFFPARTICYACMNDTLAVVPLSPEGVLYSITTVHVAAGRATPYTIGFVDLRDGVRVLAPIEGDPLPELDAIVHLGTADEQWWFGAAAEEKK